MAEKRAVDRAILKLLGLHGFVYSEDEMDLSQTNTNNNKVGASDTDVLEKFQKEIELQLMQRFSKDMDRCTRKL